MKISLGIDISSYITKATAQEEQNALRTEYRQSVVGNLKGQLNNTVVIRPDGSSYRPADKKKSK